MAELRLQSGMRCLRLEQPRAQSSLDRAGYLHQNRFSEPNYYVCKGPSSKFGGMNVSDAQRLKALEAEDGTLKGLLAHSMLELNAMREVLHRKVVNLAATARSCGSGRTWT